MLFVSYVGLICTLCVPCFTRALHLKNLDRNWFLIDIDFCKPRVLQGLSLNFNLFLEILHKCQVKTQTF